MDKDGRPDFSFTLRVMTPEEAGKRVKELYFQKAIQEAEKVGLDENELRLAVQVLGVNDSPIRRRGYLASLARETQGVTADGVLSIVRGYQKEKIRLSEKGDLTHYHQTSFEVLDSAASMGGLMCFNKLKEVGKQPSSSGSRPDVVQMTRDKFDGEGNLRERGW